LVHGGVVVIDEAKLWSIDALRTGMEVCPAATADFLEAQRLICFIKPAGSRA